MCLSVIRLISLALGGGFGLRSGGWLTLDIALESVGLGPVFLAPNSRFIMRVFAH